MLKHLCISLYVLAACSIGFRLGEKWGDLYLGSELGWVNHVLLFSPLLSLCLLAEKQQQRWSKCFLTYSFKAVAAKGKLVF